MAKQTANNVVKAMNEAGQLSPLTDDDDKRLKKIEFTEPGQVCAKAWVGPIIDIEEKVHQRLGESRVELLLEATTADGDILREETQKLG